MIVHIELPMRSDWADPATWEVDLREVITGLIDFNCDHDTGKVIDAEGIAILGGIRDGLRELAQTLDDAMVPAPFSKPKG